MPGYHIFNVRIDGVWCRTPKIHDDAELESLMDLIEWRLPYNMSVFHYETAPGSCPIHNNRVMRERPVIDLDIEEFLTGRLPAGSKVHLQDRETRETVRVSHQLSNFVILETEDQYSRAKILQAGRDRLISDFEVIPLLFKEAKEYVNTYHRHNVAPQGHKFSIGIRVGEELIGVVIASMPKARSLNDKFTLEINRCCTNELYFNACSKLYSLAIATGKTMGFRRFITYTLPKESGSSLKAVGFTVDGMTEPAPRGWNTPSRKRDMPERYPLGKKVRWIKHI